MKITFRTVVIIGCALFIGIPAMLGMAGALVYFLSSPGAPNSQTAQAQPLDAAEKATLDEILKAADVRYEDLRQVGVQARLDMDVNDRAIAIERGHIRLLILRKVPIPAATLPQLKLSTWKELEVLAITDCGLTTFPDLSECAVLRVVDLARNNITTIPATAVPPQVIKLLDLNANPALTDISPLARLIKCESIDARGTKVSNFDALIALPLTLLDLRGAPVTAMPAQLPASQSFRVDVEGCPVTSAPGFLTKWNFVYTPGSTGTGSQTSTGMARRDSVNASGTWENVHAFSKISLPTDPKAAGYSLDPVDVEVSVTTGKLRVYLTASQDPRGPWFQKGYVKGTDNLFQNITKIYADAEPGRPARMHGNLDFVNGHAAYFVVEPLGATVTGMSWRVWREK